MLLSSLFSLNDTVLFQFEQFIIELYDVFDADSLVTSHPIYVPVNNPVEIKEIFDAISYGKVSILLFYSRVHATYFTV